MKNYLMEDKMEGKRILNKTKRIPTLEHLNISGLQKGMYSIDVGCASGEVTREMAGIAYPAKVVGFDASDARIRESMQLDAKRGISNIDYICGDAYSMPCDDMQFDFVWSRFLFEYVKNPLKVLKELKRIVKKGSMVVVADLDGNGMFHFPISKKLINGVKRTIRVINERAFFDPYVGRKLYSYFYEVGFKEIEVSVLPYHLIAGVASVDIYDHWKAKLDILERNIIKLVPDRYEEVRFVFKEMLKYFLKPDTITYSTLFIVKGTK